MVQESSETHPPRIPAGIFLTGSFNLTSNLSFLRIGSLIGRESHCPLQREFKKKTDFFKIIGARLYHQVLDFFVPGKPFVPYYFEAIVAGFRGKVALKK